MIALLLALEAAASPAVSVASDAFPWLLDGYSAIVMVEPEKAPRLRTSVEVWGMQFPTSFIEMVPENEGRGWERNINAAVATTADFHPAGQGRGWHVGLTINTMHSVVSRDGYSGQADFWTLEFLPRVGYRWFPLPGRGLFVNPWLGLGQLNTLGEPGAVGGVTYVEPLLQPLGTLHVGWQLGGDR